MWYAILAEDNPGTLETRLDVRIPLLMQKIQVPLALPAVWLLPNLRALLLQRIGQRQIPILMQAYMPKLSSNHSKKHCPKDMGNMNIVSRQLFEFTVRIFGLPEDFIV